MTPADWLFISAYAAFGLGMFAAIVRDDLRRASGGGVLAACVAMVFVAIGCAVWPLVLGFEIGSEKE